jgi:hypothetical protein
MIEKTCIECGISFQAAKNAARFCTLRCAALSRVPNLVQRNKARRKYPAIHGLSKQQIYYRHNPNAPVFHRDKTKREYLIRFLGARCAMCAYDENISGMVLDHKDGDGYKDRKILGSKVSRYYVKNLQECKERLQVLCATCNQIKSIERREHNRSRRVDRKNAVLL